jgi:Fe-S oxidoreductase
MAALPYTTMFETVRAVGKLLEPEGFSYFTELPPNLESPLVIHLSCMAHYTPHIPQLAERILEKIGMSCVILGGPENCCGELQKHFNDLDLARQTAKLSMAAFRRTRPQHVVSICPDCDEHFRAQGVERQPYRHTNISYLFRDNLDKIRPHLKPVKLRAVAHSHNVNEARRADADNMLEIIKAIPGVELFESRHSTGPGIHCQTTHPMPVVDRDQMFQEAVALGAEAIIVPYHSCYRQHVKMQIKSGVVVHHYFSILAMSLGIDFTEPFKELRLLDDVDAVVDVLRSRMPTGCFDEKLAREQIQRAIFC